MRTWLVRCAVLMLPLLASAASRGSPLDFNLRGYDAPFALPGINPPRLCTVTYLVEDFVANETYAARMRFTPAFNALPVKGGMPCPALVPQQVGERALDGCRDHAGKQSDCVFADMASSFRGTPAIANSNENASRCESDRASQIAIACLDAGGLDLCSVGCGDDRDGAIAAARNRCQAAHGNACTITGVLPVAAP